MPMTAKRTRNFIILELLVVVVKCAEASERVGVWRERVGVWREREMTTVYNATRVAQKRRTNECGSHVSKMQEESGVEVRMCVSSV